MGTKGNSLFQLPQADGIKFFIQFRLSDKQDLKQLFLGSFKIAEEPDLLQNFRRKMMRFVDDQCSRQTSLAPSNDVLRNLKQQFTLILAAARKAQITRQIL